MVSHERYLFRIKCQINHQFKTQSAFNIVEIIIGEVLAQTRVSVVSVFMRGYFGEQEIYFLQLFYPIHQFKV